ncbi:MAG: AAA family ATPase [Cytophagales bacterium]|nr:AAA family ATPase [Cytophagales bacterium]
MENKREKGLFFMEQLTEIHTNKDLLPLDKYTQSLKDLLNDISKDSTSAIAVQFSNLFSRLTYLSKQYKLEKSLQYELHAFRIESRKLNKIIKRGRGVQGKFKTAQYEQAVAVISIFIEKLYKVEISEQLHSLVAVFYEKTEKVEEKTASIIVRERMRVVLNAKEEDKLFCRDEENLFPNDIEVDCKHLDTRWFWEGAQLLLFDCKTTDYKVYRPSLIVLEPDYLVDVSAVANCFKDVKNNKNAEGFALFQFVRKFMPNASSKHILLGNIVNDLFDALINDFDGKDFKTLFTRSFKKYPLEYVTTDLDSTFYNDALGHYTTLRKVLKEDFGTIGIKELKEAITEPSFISAEYGLQGRLDLLSNQEQKLNIVELKSGKLYSTRPNGINLSYHAQALLYKYLISSVWKKDEETIDTYILYSKPLSTNLLEGLEHPQLRYAVPYKELAVQLFNVRNRIVALDYQLANESLEQVERIFANLNLKHTEVKYDLRFPSFSHSDFHEMQQVLQLSSPLEKQYFFAYARFIAKEQFLAKLGNARLETDKGFARLWQNDFPNNMDDSIIQGLQIADQEQDIKINHSAKTIRFQRPFQESEVNFREGDLCILYAGTKDTDVVTNHQIFKCFITEITKEELVLKFRNQQSKTIFLENENWTIVPDFMEIGFRSMHQGIYAFLSASAFQKKLWLGLEMPRVAEPYVDEITRFEGEFLNPEQEGIIRKILEAKDYFLLVGPPGTGKTSTVLKHLVRELYKRPSQNILVLAYTNRAVDEISEAVDNAISYERKDKTTNFIRIGSELSTAPKFRKNLLPNLEFTKRAELMGLIHEHRVFVSTTSTFSNRQDLLKIKEFDTVIIDEASQILEPQIIGLLPKFQKVIMIGDEKQLPAISTQDDSFTVVTEHEEPNKDLRTIGLMNLKNSLFDRMLVTCKKKQWIGVYDTLTTQYRMHGEISEFPNMTFYKGLLKVGVAPHQLETSLYSKYNQYDYVESLVAQNRLLFFPSQINSQDVSLKVNSDEASMVSCLIRQIISLYAKNGQTFDPQKTVGVITPFRSQIAQIKKQLEVDNIEGGNQIIVDTVERFQGSQRDIIIISLCMNSKYQVKNLTNAVEFQENEKEEALWVDRKLNVALTRAKKQQFIIGNDTLLSAEPIYAQLLHYVDSLGKKVPVSVHSLLKNKEEIPAHLTWETNVYESSKEFKNAFHALVKTALTPKNQKTIDLEDHERNLSIILKYAYTNFDKRSVLGHYPQLKVDLFNYYYLSKLYHASIAFLENNQEVIEAFAQTDKIQLVDVDSKTITMAWAMKEVLPELSFDYVGVDKFEQIRKKAQIFSTVALFGGNSCELIKSIDQCNSEGKKVWINFGWFVEMLNYHEVEKLITYLKELKSNQQKVLISFLRFEGTNHQHIQRIQKELGLKGIKFDNYNLHVIDPERRPYENTLSVHYEIWEL